MKHFYKIVSLISIFILIPLIVVACKQDNKELDIITTTSDLASDDILDTATTENPPNELVVAAMNLQNDKYTWLVEGIKEYVKYKEEIGKNHIVDSLPSYEEKQKYTDGSAVTANFLLWMEQNIDKNIVYNLVQDLQNNKFSDQSWYDLTGNTITVLWDKYAGKIDSKEIAANHNIYFGQANSKDEIKLAFAGDINFDENWSTMKYFNQLENGSYECLSQDLIQEMVSADIMMLNNEFTYSDRGEPLTGKAYTFRANPDRVHILKDWGVDLVSLANNHIYDYGADSFYDTLTTLKGAGIPYVGAGVDRSEAIKPVYYIINGKKIAYVSATRAEKYILTPEATDSQPGVLRTYDSALFLDVIRTAKENSDYVVAYVHWGTEYSEYADENQKILGKEYIEAGADIVLGGHSHCLQGIEYYKGKPIIYSLSDFWFNDWTTDTVLVNVIINKDNSISVKYLPCIQSKVVTSLVTEENEKQRILDYIEKISYSVNIDEKGLATQITE